MINKILAKNQKIISNSDLVTLMDKKNSYQKPKPDLKNYLSHNDLSFNEDRNQGNNFRNRLKRSQLGKSYT